MTKLLADFTPIKGTRYVYGRCRICRNRRVPIGEPARRVLAARHIASELAPFRLAAIDW